MRGWGFIVRVVYYRLQEYNICMFEVGADSIFFLAYQCFVEQFEPVIAENHQFQFTVPTMTYREATS
jgi:hypothetical protein